MTALSDLDAVVVGRRRLRAVYTPGHARHHLAYHDETHNIVFTGDAAAVRIQGYSYVRPPTPPPELDLEAWDRSFQRLCELRPAALCLTHFGAFRDVEDHLTQARSRLFEWAEVVKDAMQSGQQPPEIVDALRLRGDSELLAQTEDAEVLERYELASPYGMSVDGYRRYWKRALG
jgi:glyoxylase-like metal-dependent hydrolase (beta-lactamase superfamily II)